MTVNSEKQLKVDRLVLCEMNRCLHVQSRVAHLQGGTVAKPCMPIYVRQILPNIMKETWAIHIHQVSTITVECETSKQNVFIQSLIQQPMTDQSNRATGLGTFQASVCKDT
jgi:hypothetical protein